MAKSTHKKLFLRVHWVGVWGFYFELNWLDEWSRMAFLTYLDLECLGLSAWGLSSRRLTWASLQGGCSVPSKKEGKPPRHKHFSKSLLTLPVLISCWPRSKSYGQTQRVDSDSWWARLQSHLTKKHIHTMRKICGHFSLQFIKVHALATNYSFPPTCEIYFYTIQDPQNSHANCQTWSSELWSSSGINVAKALWVWFFSFKNCDKIYIT